MWRGLCCAVLLACSSSSARPLRPGAPRGWPPRRPPGRPRLGAASLGEPTEGALAVPWSPPPGAATAPAPAEVPPSRAPARSLGGGARAPQGGRRFVEEGRLLRGRGRRVVGGGELRGRRPAGGAEPAQRRRAAGLLGALGLASAASWLLGPRASQDPLLQPGAARSTGAIEQGSVLLSRPGGHFADRQQYFHKSVILIVRHRADFDLGIILNRPTGVLSSQLGLPGPPRSVWFGGDCEGLRPLSFLPPGELQGSPRMFCLHTDEEQSLDSTRIASGVYSMDSFKAQQLAIRGDPRANDFMFFAGYCGWGAGQLQDELDRGDVWKLATVDSQIIIREMREAALELRALSTVGLDDGIAEWRHFYSAVDAGLPMQVRGPEDVVSKDDRADDRLADQMLRDWVQLNLQGLA